MVRVATRNPIANFPLITYSSTSLNGYRHSKICQRNTTNPTQTHVDSPKKKNTSDKPAKDVLLTSQPGRDRLARLVHTHTPCLQRLGSPAPGQDHHHRKPGRHARAQGHGQRPRGHRVRRRQQLRRPRRPHHELVPCGQLRARGPASGLLDQPPQGVSYSILFRSFALTPSFPYGELVGTLGGVVCGVRLEVGGIA
jgi:hypothetical protein